MPTNEERKAVAARLRKYTDFDFGDSNPWWYLMKAVYSDVAIHDDNELFTRLTDLIEPEERTCRNQSKDFAVFWCSECGYFQRDVPCANFCPNCGYEVTKQ